MNALPARQRVFHYLNRRVALLDTIDGIREISVRSLFPLSLALCLVGNVSPVFADKDMLQKNNCFACHSIDKRKYGPKLVEVAKKYAGDEDAVQMLARKIQAGGSGVWGEDIMPPQPQVSDGDAAALAKYILSLP